MNLLFLAKHGTPLALRFRASAFTRFIMSGATTQTFTLPHIPELYDAQYLDTLLPAHSKTSPKLDPSPSSPDHPPNAMMDALMSSANQTLTENGAQAFKSTGSATLDAFQRLKPTSDSSQIDSLLSQSWKEDPDTTLRVIWHIRSIHDGKAEKELFYVVFGWLYKHHPRTALINLPFLIEPSGSRGLSYGYWKDLLNILALATDGDVGSFDDQTRRRHRNTTPEERLSVATSRHDTVVARLADPTYRALYITVARLFASRLMSDVSVLCQADGLSPDDRDYGRLLRQLSLAGKWAPTPGGSHDRLTNISTAIVSLIHYSHPTLPLTFPSALGTCDRDAHLSRDAAQVLRSYYQRWILTRLRGATLVPEPLMSSRQWTKIKYSRVPSVCMRNNSRRFYEHDPEGYQQYLIDVESGKKTISGATLFPHDILRRLTMLSTTATKSRYPKLAEFKRKAVEAEKRSLEAQWKTMIENLKQSGRIENAIAICDVSGSMGIVGYSGDDRQVPPIYPALALSIVLAELAKPPFNGGFITFSNRPEFVKIDREHRHGLGGMVKDMVGVDWEMNTDLKRVFLDLILPLAKQNNVKKEDMIKRLFVFSDMQFDTAQSHSAKWETNYSVIEREFVKAGYDVPEIVYWDLGGYDTVEVEKDRKGVAMLSGRSASLMKAFMGEEDENDEEKAEKEEKEKEKEPFNPLNMMKQALGRKSFDGLVVVD